MVDTRAAADYEKGHLPGVVSLPVTDTFDPLQQRNYPAPRDVLARLVAGRGIGTNDRVVVYDGGAETAAPRLFWTLEHLGHRNVAVLDGGVRAWQAAGGEVTPALPDPPAATFVPAMQPQLLHRLQDCLGHAGAGTVVMLDARSPEEYRGDDVRAKFGGHILGAVNVDWRLLFADNARLRESASVCVGRVGALCQRVRGATTPRPCATVATALDGSASFVEVERVAARSPPTRYLHSAATTGRPR